MGKERTVKVTKKARSHDVTLRVSRFIHIGEIIPGVLENIERRIKKNAKKGKGEQCSPIQFSNASEYSEILRKCGNKNKKNRRY